METGKRICIEVNLDPLEMQSYVSRETCKCTLEIQFHSTKGQAFTLEMYVVSMETDKPYKLK